MTFKTLSTHALNGHQRAMLDHLTFGAVCFALRLDSSLLIFFKIFFSRPSDQQRLEIPLETAVKLRWFNLSLGK